MEPHPVPKNVLNVDFKLFGSLSVKQFFKVVGVCGVGLLLFALPIPKLVTIPIIAVVVILGLLAALIPSFQVRLFGFLRALFVSPQYVWKKEQLPPEVLQRQQQQAIESTSISKVAKANATPSLTRLSIDQLIDAKNLAQGVDENTEDLLDLTATESAGFERYYAEEFANSKPARASGTQRSLAAGNTQTVAPVTKPIKSFSNLNQAVTNLANNQNVATNFDAAKAALNQLIPVSPDQPRRYIYGIVVDKNEVAIAAATVTLLNDMGQQVEPQTISASDGRFSLDITGLVFGSYVMRILHPRFAFYDFRVNYDDQKLPAYKFKARQ